MFGSMIHIYKVVVLAVLLSAHAAVALPAHTQLMSDQHMPESVGDTIVEFVNFYPGSDIYQLEGHSALRITMPDGDYAITYGMFNFGAPNFVYRFVKGETDYWVAAADWLSFCRGYVNEGRRIVSHRLNMTSDQKKRLVDLVSDNLMPANRVYRYNYVLDNCATRPLAIVERALGDTILLGDVPSHLKNDDVTFRDIMCFYHANYPWYQFGIDLALGSGIDYTLSNREKSFAPVVLDEQLRRATAGGQPLVEKTTVINDVPADNAVLPPTPWYRHPMTICWLVFALILLSAYRDLRRGRLNKTVYVVVYGVYGLAGCLLVFLVLISHHYATSPNWLLVWLNPLSLIVPALIWSRHCRRVVFIYMAANCIALVLLVVIWPFLAQSTNAAFWPLIAADIILSAAYIIINKTYLSQKDNK